MCGFFCVIERNGIVDQAKFRNGFDQIQHRGPDFSDIKHSSFTDSESSVRFDAMFGHHRLSILDVEERSHQPFVRNGKTLLYNGEIYNFRALRRQYLSDQAMETSGDTEVLFSMLERFGVDSLKDANGMWSFCFVDPMKGSLVAGRDRYGKKPLFFYQDNHSICFASAIQPILDYKSLVGEVCSDQIDSFLIDGFLFPSSGSETYLKNIHQVPNGSVLKFNFQSWDFQIDSDPSTKLSLDGSENLDQETLNELLEDAVRSRLVSDRNVALLLSGGIDSSLILSVLSHIGKLDTVKCFIGDTGTSDDAEYAKKCAAQLGLDVEILEVDYGSASFDRFLQMCRHQEKPFPLVGNSMAMAEMYQRIADFDISVVLDGTGGDEVFGGYWDRYFPTAVRTAIDDRSDDWLNQMIEEPYEDYSYSSGGVIQSVKEEKLDTTVSVEAILNSRRNLPIAQYCRPEVIKCGVRDPLVQWNGSFQEMLVVDSTKGRLGEWIWHNDRNAMMASIENRSPFLDYRLFPFIKTGYAKKFVKQYNKFELRKAFDAFTPLVTQWRTQKQGFRWVAYHFLKSNASEILGLIESSKILEQKLDLNLFLERAKDDDQVLCSSATSKMLCIAGLESTFRLSL